MGIVNVNYDPAEAAKAAAGGPRSRVMPEGWYVLRVVEEPTQKEATKQGSYPNLICKCEILQSFNGANIGGKVTRKFNLHPNSIPYNLLPFLRAAGVPCQDNGQGLAFDTAAIRGASTKADCQHSKGDQVTFENWENDEPLGGAPAGAPAMTPQAFQQQPQQQFAPQAGWAPPGAPPQQFAPPQQPMPQQPMPQQGFPQQGMQGSFPQQPMQQQPAPQPGFPQGQQGAPPPWMTGVPGRGNGVQGG